MPEDKNVQLNQTNQDPAKLQLAYTETNPSNNYTCSECGQTGFDPKGFSVNPVNNEIICVNCASHLLFQTCSVCGKKSSDPTDFYTDEDDDSVFCRSCGGKCQACDRVVKKGEMTYHDRKWYCQDCFDEKYNNCPNCDSIIEKDEYLPPTPKNRYHLKHGGCTECSFKCSGCSRVTDNDSGYSYDQDQYCEDCYDERFTSCSECNETVPQEDSRRSEEDGDNYCESCYRDKFTLCHKCGDEIEKESAKEFDGEEYCDECFEKQSTKALEPFKPLIENMNEFSWTKKDRFLERIIKLLPISVRELKAKHPSIAQGLADLISFAKGKDITAETVQKYRESQGVEEFPVEYSTWTELQRSVETLPEMPVETPQLVIKIIASDEMLKALKSNRALYNLFDRINTVSNKSTHPYSPDQIGWARLELDPNKNFILVDEIQCDHSNAAYKLKTERYGELVQVRNSLKRQYDLDDAGFDALLDQYHSLMKNFPDIATAAVTSFAKKNGYKKLYWHTLESGKNLKKNSPPESLYTKVPKENFFQPTEERPFNLPGQFLSREAAAAQRLKIAARHIQLKAALRNHS